jgi:hypothetical protein
LRIDDFDKACYAIYSDSYDERYIEKGKDIFFDAHEYPEEEDMVGTPGTIFQH